MKVIYCENQSAGPKKIIRSLKSSWEDLEQILKGNQLPNPHHFEELGTMFEVIGEAIDKSENKIYWLIADSSDL